MGMWFYQMNQKLWPPQRYRLEIWEGQHWRWSVGKKTGANESPKPGDTVIFFYAPSGGQEAGFYGWAVITEWIDGDGREDRMYFRPVAPSDHLKMHPWFDNDAKKLADEIRGGVKKGTLWRVPSELWERVQKGFTAWLCGQPRPTSARRRG